MDNDRATGSTVKIQSVMADREGGEEERDSDEKVEVKGGVFDTRAKKLTIFCISLYWFIVACAYSMIAPFFPGEVSSLSKIRPL